MRTQHFKRTRLGLMLVVALALIVFALVSTSGTAGAAGTGTNAEGMVCTEGAAINPTFTLKTNTGYVGTPDDNVVFMWGFSEGNSPFQYPGPILCVNEGDTVTIILQNTLPESVSIVFPGQDDVLADGAPAQPQFDVSGNLTSLAQAAPANGGSITYSFVANHPGTFVYQSGTNPAKQVRMGLFGAIVVRPALEQTNPGRRFANNRPDSEFNPEGEFLVLFSEIDPYLNQAVELGKGFNMNNYQTRYWMINGRGFPDTIAPNFASWLPSQPYGALARVHPFNDTEFLGDGVTPNPAYNPLPYLERFVNVGTEVIPMHPHAKNALLVNQDGRAVEGPGEEDLAWENFSVPVAPGQTYDGLFKYRNEEEYSPTNPVPITIPNVPDLVYGQLYSGSPYLGVKGPLPVGAPDMNDCGEFYIISHNHALYQITSWGVPASGPITFLRIDPPLPNACH
ncbi:MAG: multicopper oxidase domain-containing protein [Chloroflexota bacterium]